MSTPSHIKDIDLSGLNAHQKDLALKLLIITEEADSFSRDDSDVSCIKDLELNLDLEDQTPCSEELCGSAKTTLPTAKG